MKQRTVNLLYVCIWILLIITGAWLHGVINPKVDLTTPKWLAARDLPANHLIRTEDLKSPAGETLGLPEIETLVGKYLQEAITSGMPVISEDVDTDPSLASIGSQEAALLYSLEASQAALASLLDSGAYVKPCRTFPFSPDKTGDSIDDSFEICYPQTIEVLAIGPADQENQGAWLLLKVPLNEETNVSPYLIGEGRYLTIVPAP
jgi:hypothetical protein